MTKDETEAWDLVLEFFKGDLEKTALWFITPNPLLGGITPDDMIDLGRARKLLQFIKEQLAENKK